MTPIEISEDAFIAIFQPIRNHLDPHAGFDFGDGFGTLFETYGVELEFVRRQDPAHVWTLIETDEGGLVVCSGFHRVNRLGYFVTAAPAPTDIEAPLDARVLGMTADERTALHEVVDYLADEELSYEQGDDLERKNHIWTRRETLRRLLEGGQSVATGNEIDVNAACGSFPPLCESTQSGPSGQTQTQLAANHVRAARFGALLRRSGDGSEVESRLVDLLTDARHWCDRQGLSFADPNRIAQDHYDAEQP